MCCIGAYLAGYPLMAYRVRFNTNVIMHVTQIWLTDNCTKGLTVMNVDNHDDNKHETRAQNND